MTIKALSSTALQSLRETRLGATGVFIWSIDAADYDARMMDALHKLDLAAFGHFRVAEDDASATTIRVMPGRMVGITGTAMAYAGGAVDLAAYNNATAFVWMYDNAGAATVGSGVSTSGWPTTPHIPLAEVVLASGVITSILDRRMEFVYQLGLMRAARRFDSDGNFVAKSYSDATRPTPGTAGRVIYNTTDSKLNIDNGTTWTLPDGTAT
jgi:hypothetical protein